MDTCVFLNLLPERRIDETLVATCLTTPVRARATKGATVCNLLMAISHQIETKEKPSRRSEERSGTMQPDAKNGGLKRNGSSPILPCWPRGKLLLLLLFHATDIGVRITEAHKAWLGAGTPRECPSSSSGFENFSKVT
ncbi:hypothetical protein ZHAS_00017531 [Anopheles sinensis]|uniref:Uncharacterized protein n=1 Tax=Anopheles sinensis TaxID=74873 RepID=A0A084WGT4_ANOSI|nr:hypothetical protein ZHAS_00017531 [Anopheles sinensis]